MRTAHNRSSANYKKRNILKIWLPIYASMLDPTQQITITSLFATAKSPNFNVQLQQSHNVDSRF